ncbi:YkoP family protein [Paenibacillus harenae]|uniref:YkoP family protein n=1 Tax=Paenibacillus harenae TaxID=306543 RepID=UPI00048D7F46|nr:hypothetical protein [Paenibacillus harenae]
MWAGTRKTIIRSLWMTWEKGFGYALRWRSPCTLQYGICKLMLKRHSGDRIECQDGTRIRSGDWVGELHLDNGKVLQLLQSGGSDRAALHVARMARDSLRQISDALETKPELSQVKALIGVTLLHRGITHGLGFERHPLRPGAFRRLSTSYLRLLLSAMHPDGTRRIGLRKEQLVPIMLVHTRASLKERFAPAPG